MEEFRNKKKVLKRKFTLKVNKFEEEAQQCQDIESLEVLYAGIKEIHQQLVIIFDEWQVSVADDDAALDILIKEQDEIKYRYSCIRKMARKLFHNISNPNLNISTSGSENESFKTNASISHSTPTKRKVKDFFSSEKPQDLSQEDFDYAVPQLLENLNLNMNQQQPCESRFIPEASQFSTSKPRDFLTNQQQPCERRFIPEASQFSTSKLRDFLTNQQQPCERRFIPEASQFCTQKQRDFLTNQQQHNAMYPTAKEMNFTVQDQVPSAPPHFMVNAPPLYTTFNQQMSVNQDWNMQHERMTNATSFYPQPITHTQNPYGGTNPTPIYTQSAMTNGNQHTNLPPHMNPYQHMQIPMMPVRLKPLELLPFSGEPHDWEQFRDTFNAMIHSAPMYDIEKFQRLQSLLKGGKAESFMKNMQVTTQNYQVVWNDLKAYYDNPRRIAMSHVNEMFNLRSINSENSNALRAVVDAFKNHLRGLQAAKQSENVEIFQIQLLLSKLDEGTRSKWQSKIAMVKEVPKLQDLYQLIEKRIHSLEAMTETKPLSKISSNISTMKKSNSMNSKRIVYLTTSKTDKVVCIICNEDHYQTYRCPTYISASNEEKLNIVKKYKLCHNCLKTGHSYKYCNSSECRESNCHQKHHTSLHSILSKKSESNCLTTRAEVPGRKKALIATAVVLVYDDNDRPYRARILLDGCSEDNFITNALAKKLKLATISESIDVSGINLQSSSSTTTVNVKLRSTNCEHSLNVNCIVMEDIADNLPSTHIDITSWNIPKKCNLADPFFNRPASIDLLLSADIFYGSLNDGLIKLGNDKPHLINTKFGWLVGGGSYSNKIIVNLAVVPQPVKSFVTQQSISKQMEQFWNIESFPETKVRSQEDQRSENLFNNSYQRKENRFTVELPFKADPSQLGDNLRKKAECLWFATERKFGKDERIQIMYNEFMKTYIDMGHMVEVDPSEIRYFIPHHHVWKSTASEDKFRVVFNGSAKTSTGTSLNDLLMIGPVVQDELVNILMRFRKHPIAIAGDLEKMYRMINVRKEDQIYQGIVWRENPNQPLKYFKLCTLTYGTAPAAFLATRCLQEATVLDEDQFPTAVVVAKHDFYVDDLLTGALNKEDAIYLRQEMQKFCKNSGFVIRKWVSNSKEVLDTIPDDLKAKNVMLNFDLNETVKTLGIQWCPSTDQFKFCSYGFSNTNTKRSVLSDIARLFDPLGLLGPVVLLMKVFMQELWKQDIDWDQELPTHLLKTWLKYKQEMKHVEDIQISRKVIIRQDPISLYLFGFSDASEKGYGACIYLVAKYEDQTIGKLICSRSRVAPVKTQSIPKLELCGALLLAELLVATASAIQIDSLKMFAFTDSNIVLSWLNKEPANWKVFVANRVSKIITLVPFECWFHISSPRNPADVLSRGCIPIELKDNELWWNGPQEIFERLLRPKQPCKIIDLPMEDTIIIDAERKINTQVMIAKTTECEDVIEKLIHDNSDLNFVVRVIGYVRRFLFNCFCKNDQRKHGPLTYDELFGAKVVMARQAQARYYSSEIKAIKSNSLLPNKSKLHVLKPLWDPKLQCLRVGGRLTNADIPTSMKHPIILPSEAKFTKMLFIQEHINLLHAGPQLLLSEIRKKWWPVNGKRLASKVLRECVRCFRVKPSLQTQIMADLPKSRLTATKPFLNCGVDFAGPIETMQHEGTRCRIYKKSYFALFICLSTRAIHIESVTDLTTNAFMATLRRFVSRRGKVRNIFSDNGSNLVGANNQLRALYDMIRSQEATETMNHQFDYIKWNFICVSSPHTGSIWESNIKSVKHHLHRVIGLTRLNFEQFTTVLAQIEACVNSRPICILSETPEEILPLTPGHFLTGESLMAVPDYDYLEEKPNRLDKWCQMQRMVQDFWKAWHLEYIHSLQVRYRWQTECENLKSGDVVLVKDDNLKPLQWKLGRVTKTMTGNDGKIRSVEIFINNHHTTRTVHKLCKLPLQDLDIEN